MRTRWVSLSTDALPTYATWAPVVAHVWKSLGYRTAIHLHVDHAGWATPFGEIVRRELERVDAMVAWIPTTRPLSVGSTMRASRIFAAHTLPFAPDDFVLTADADIVPLDAKFFDRSEDFVVLRPLYQRWCHAGGQQPPLRDEDFVPSTNPNMQMPGLPMPLRFPQCYTGATARIWRELMPSSLAEMVKGFGHDNGDLDELRTTHAILSSPRIRGTLVELERGHWRRGELHLVDPVDRPLLLRTRVAFPRGALVGSQGWTPKEGPIPFGAVDFQPARFEFDEPPWWCFDVVRMRYPHLSSWLDTYRRDLELSGWTPGRHPPRTEGFARMGAHRTKKVRMSPVAIRDEEPVVKAMRPPSMQSGRRATVTMSPAALRRRSS